ncbi:ArsR/SmtB family transcription factor [Allonocardiopsis opalescens]|uniref:DNA-binding transcriptional ArsR family regulator n=1 Tax=Allonocardiopsis opalescens TaxID=1144618 RepID=A0A2T0Q7C7_9ACTN|nr:winged helix-turn-helix domain-containing protein [Allonocardiopsis opalescens]PRX99736.1 DNA-binding transcriptional ArsR family regulator [Allonocardiopsis opalescens]
MLGTYHRYVIAPYELQIRSEIDADRLRRTRALLDGGIDGLLHSFRPLMRWEPPILHVTYPFSRDLHLRGRGLRLIPAYFCTRHSITLADPELPPVLAYPLHNGTVRFPASERDAGALAQLLGATRARALEAIASGCTTTELGRVLGVSSAAASQHARTLREAGLVSSNRERQHVLHSITPLGTALLDRQDLPRAC